MSASRGGPHCCALLGADGGQGVEAAHHQIKLVVPIENSSLHDSSYELGTFILSRQNCFHLRLLLFSSYRSCDRIRDRITCRTGYGFVDGKHEELEKRSCIRFLQMTRIRTSSN